MGGASSKPRRLPTSLPSTARPLPRAPAVPAEAQAAHIERADAAEPVPETPGGLPAEKDDYVGPSRNLRGDYGFSGDKDDAIKRDAMDPHFMANLSHLGQVRIHDAGRFVRTPAQAQRTLSSRDPALTSPTSAPPRGHLPASALVALLDALKAVPAHSARRAELCSAYNIDPDVVCAIGTWVNSVSVGEEVERVEQGRKVVEMKAVWVDPPTA
ncbi:hypothetical protein Q5752_005686 [Cryptotrichosporon argae]